MHTKLRAHAHMPQYFVATGPKHGSARVGTHSAYMHQHKRTQVQIKRLPHTESPVHTHKPRGNAGVE